MRGLIKRAKKFDFIPVDDMFEYMERKGYEPKVSKVEEGFNNMKIFNVYTHFCDRFNNVYIYSLYDCITKRVKILYITKNGRVLYNNSDGLYSIFSKIYIE